MSTREHVHADSVECEDLVEALTERFEETLLAPTRHRVQAHLVQCESCRAFVARRRHLLNPLARDIDLIDPASWDATALTR